MRTFAISFLAVLVASAAAESVTWSPGTPIDVPLEVSVKPDSIKSRTITLPGTAIQPVDGAWNKGDLDVDIVAHKITLTLNSPTLTTPIHLHDASGNTFTLLVRPETARRLDPELIVEDARALPDDGAPRAGTAGGHARLVDSYSEITRMFRVMMGAAIEPDVRIQEILTRAPDGTMVAGEVVEDSDDMRITLLRGYVGPALTGLEALVEWKRDYPVAINLQQLTYDRSADAQLVAIASDQAVVMPSSGPAQTILERGRGVRVYFLEERLEEMTP